LTASYAEVELARRLAPLPRPLLLVGQSGVGKGLLARFVTGAQRRVRGAFIMLNLSERQRAFEPNRRLDR